MMISDQEYQFLTDIVSTNVGIYLGPNKKTMVSTRLAPFLEKNGFHNLGEYLQYLMADPSGKSLKELTNHLTTNYSFFYREKEHFEFLKQVLLPQRSNPNIIANSPNIHIWSAGCSTGEEAYTLAIILRDFFEQPAPWDLGVFATDIDTNVLSYAQTGIYTTDQLQAIPPLKRLNYFEQTGTNEWKVRSFIKDLIYFSCYNLIKPKFIFKGKFFAIFCRNVMIYFKRSTVETLIQRFYEVTEEGGYLFIGQTESLDKSICPYEYVAPSIYQKRRTS